MSVRDVEAQAKTRSDKALQMSKTLRAFEVRVAQCIKAKFPTAILGTWRVSDRRDARDFLERFGREQTWRIVEFAVSRWAHLHTQKALSWLSPVPTFHDVYAARDRIAAHLAAYDAEQARSAPMYKQAVPERVALVAAQVVPQLDVDAEQAFTDRFWQISREQGLMAAVRFGAHWKGRERAYHDGDDPGPGEAVPHVPPDTVPV